MGNLEKLYEYLLSDNVELYEEEIFKIIPELSYEVGMEQKSSWHSLDVWNHTLKAVEACDKNKLDRLTLLLHDIGKPFSYQDDNEVRHFKNHATKSFIISTSILDRLGIEKEEKELILKLIKAHASKINLEDINKDNMDFYKRLLKIKKCDASGYEVNHSKKMLEELELIDLNNVNNCQR